MENFNTLYIRLPVKIKNEQQIKDLHSDIEKVTLPRQKSRRWCKIQLKSTVNLKDTIKALKEIQINGKKVFVGPWAKKQDLKVVRKSMKVVLEKQQ